MSKKFSKNLTAILMILFLACITLGGIFQMRSQTASAAIKYEVNELAVEATNGESYTIKYVNPDMINDPISSVEPSTICMFTQGHASYFTATTYNYGVAVLVDATTFEVKQIVNPAQTPGSEATDAASKPAAWAKSLLYPGDGQFVLLGYGPSWSATDARYFLANKLQVGDTISLKQSGEATTVSDILAQTGLSEEIAITNYTFDNLAVKDANGKTFAVNYVNRNTLYNASSSDSAATTSICLYTQGHESYFTASVAKYGVAALVDANTFEVKQIVNPSQNPGADASDASSKPAAWASSVLYPLKDEFVLVAYGSAWSADDARYFLAQYKVGDVLNLTMDGENTTIADILAQTKKATTLQINNVSSTQSVSEDSFEISGKLLNQAAGTTYKVMLRQYDDETEMQDAIPTEITLLSDGSFTKTAVLKTGANYFDVYFLVGDDTEKHDKTSFTVTYYEADVNPYIVEGLEVESQAATADTSSSGVSHTITYVNPDFKTMQNEDYNYVVMFTAGHESFVTESSRKLNTAILVDAETLTVKQVFNKAPAKGATPSWSDDTCITPAEGEFVILGVDSSYANAGQKKYVAENFSVGDVIKLKLNGVETTVDAILAISESLRTVSMKLDSDVGTFTTTESQYVVEGSFEFPETGVEYRVIVRQYDADGAQVGTDIIVKTDSDYNFSQAVTLSSGTNYIQISYSADDEEKENSTVTACIYYKEQTETEKEYVMWVDQFSSSINSIAHIKSTLQKMKSAGVTAIALEVKGTEGYASYKKATYTNVPYYTETKNKQSSVQGIDYDTLEEVIKAAKNVGIKVYAAFNFFTEGVISGGDSAVLAQHPDWEEVLNAPEGKGELKTATQMNALSSSSYILNYVNPANDEVVDFQLKRVQEVLENYDVDGICMDRARYDNRYSDFSDVSKAKFEAYLKGIGKTLNKWPDDVYKIESDGSMERGSLYYDWYTFRASVIQSFVEKLRTTIDTYNTSYTDDVILSGYVGNSYASMWEMGLNWASEEFTYNSMLGSSFSALSANKKLYTEAYSKTSYLKYIDLLMVGTYSSTAAAVAQYATLANIVTNGEVSVLASIDLGTNTTAASEREIVNTCKAVTDGCMLFSASSADLYKVQAAIADRDYVKPDTFAFYFDGAGNATTISKINASRSASEYGYYDYRYGDAADANQYSVLVAVDADGKVVRVGNKEAVEAFEATGDKSKFAIPDCSIPEGGFVITTPGNSLAEPSDTRRLLARVNVGDYFTAAYLTDYVKYVDDTFDASEIDFTFAAAILGYSEGVTITVNGVDAVKGEAYESSDDTPLNIYSYSAPVTLKYGENTVKIVIKQGDVTIASQTVTVTSTKPTLERIVATDTMYKVEVGGEINLGVSLYPVEATETVTYTVADTSIASVDENGNVKGLKAGKTTILISAGEKTLTVTVTVTAATESTNTSTSSTSSSGCGSNIGGLSVLSMMTCMVGLGALMLKKRKQD